MTTIIPGPKRDLIGYEGNPPKVSWPGGARIAISLVVNYEEGSELAIGDGDASREPSGPVEWPLSKRDLAGEGAFEYGSRCGYWRLMDIFDEQEVKCTFYACAVAWNATAMRRKEMRPRGHDVMLARLALGGRLAAGAARRSATISAAPSSRSPRPRGERPLGWYCRYGPSVHTRELVVEEGGFLYDCDAYNDDLPYWTMVGPKKHLVIPYSLATNDGKFELGRLRLAGRFREVPQGELRPAVQGRGDASQDDVDRPAHAAGRPSRAGTGAGELHRLRQEPCQCLVRPPHRYRAPLDGAPRLIRRHHVESFSFPATVRDVVGYNGKPPKVTWPGGARIAISLVVNYEEGSELAVGDGDPAPERVLSESAVRPWPAGKRDLAMETMYEYGARVGFWRLMRHLRRVRRQEHLLCLRRRPRAQPQGRARNPRTRP